MVVLAGQCLRSASSGAPRVMSSVISHVCWRGLHMFMCVCVRARAHVPRLRLESVHTHQLV